MNTQKNRLLVALDGSLQASMVVDYVGETFPPEKTQIVLFHVLNMVPESLYDFESNMEKELDPVLSNAFLDERKKSIQTFMEQSKHILMEKGFSDEQIDILIESRKQGIARDILEVSRQGFTALVLGRTGVSKVKDLLIGSVASKLLNKLSEIPLIVVGKVRRNGGVIIAYDGSGSSEKAVMAVGKLLGRAMTKPIILLNIIRSLNILYMDEIQRNYPINENDWTNRHRQAIEPSMDNAVEVLVNAGIRKETIGKKILSNQVSRAESIVKEAREGGFGSIVIGRRGLSLVEAFLMGRVGNKVFQMAHDMTIWIIS